MYLIYVCISMYFMFSSIMPNLIIDVDENIKN